MNDQDLIRQAIHLGIFSTPLTKEVRAFVQNFVARADPAGRAVDEMPSRRSIKRAVSKFDPYDDRARNIRMDEALEALKKKYAKKPPRS